MKLTKIQVVKAITNQNNRIKNAKEIIFSTCKQYAEQNAKFKKGSIVYRSNIKRTQYCYSVEAYVYDYDNDTIVYTLKPINYGKNLIKLSENELSRSPLTLEDFKEMPKDVKGGKRKVDYEKVASFIKNNPTLWNDVICEQFGISLYTVYRIRKLSNLPTGKHNPRTTNHYICQHCKKVFQSKTERKFCNQKCYGDYRRLS